MGSQVGLILKQAKHPVEMQSAELNANVPFGSPDFAVISNVDALHLLTGYPRKCYGKQRLKFLAPSPTFELGLPIGGQVFDFKRFRLYANESQCPFAQERGDALHVLFSCLCQFG